MNETVESVLIDTCIWASFFSKPNLREKRAVDELIDADRVAIIGPVLAEVLLGFRRKEEADWVSSRLALAEYIELTWNDWRSAADLGRTLSAKGQKVPLTDLVIAAASQRLATPVYTTDPHFDLLPNLRRYRVEQR